MNIKTNIILTGMSGSGKSTVGVLLAKYKAKSFIDTDLIIQTKFKKRLNSIILERGDMGFMACEEDAVLNLFCTECVIATGGSVIYSEKAMAHLKKMGQVVYLDVPFSQIERRVKNARSRGVVSLKDGQSLRDIFNERLPMYKRWADVTIKCAARKPAEITAEIKEKLNGLI